MLSGYLKSWCNQLASWNQFFLFFPWFWGLEASASESSSLILRLYGLFDPQDPGAVWIQFIFLRRLVETKTTCKISTFGNLLTSIRKHTNVFEPLYHVLLQLRIKSMVEHELTIAVTFCLLAIRTSLRSLKYSRTSRLSSLTNLKSLSTLLSLTP